MRLTRDTEAAGYRLLSLDATGSTNDDALQAAREGDPGRLWIVAGEQHAGRGRHGRQWSSPPGNLYASLLLIDPCPLAMAAQLGFVAGLALHEAVEQVTGIGGPRLALKWPNDLLLDGAKVSGLLLEGHRIGEGHKLALILGMGINITHAPTGTPYPTATLKTVSPSLTRERLFEALAMSFAGAFAAWERTQHRNAGTLGPLRALWMERAAGRGETVVLRLPSGDRTGLFEGIDATGRLELRTASGLETIDAGDLYFPRTDKAAAGSTAAGTIGT